MELPDKLIVERGTNQSYPSDDFAVLAEHADVDTADPVGYELGAFDGFSKVGVIEYYLFTESSVGYIGWLEVEEEWRRQGIARELRQRAVNHLLDRGVSEIWSGPVASTVQPLVEEQGFEPANLAVSDYYVYKR